MGTLVLALLFAHATASAQGTKTVRGTVTATAPDAITVKVGERDMTFKVDSSTAVTARGGSTATREARAEGQPGAPFTSLVKAGQGVEIEYREAGMLASKIRVFPAPPPPPSPRAMSASGVVTAVSASSLAIKGTAGESTFAIDEKTAVVGSGLGTKSKSMKGAGEKSALTDFVQTGDNVSVRYTEADGTKRASEVRVTRKGKS
jgi:hypothetical protein